MGYLWLVSEDMTVLSDPVPPQNFLQNQGMGLQDLQGLALATNRYQAHLVLKCAKLI